MGFINKYHRIFLTRHPIDEFCRNKKIAFSALNLDDLTEKVNHLVEKEKIDKVELKENLYKWLYQGRKKIIFKPLKDENVIRLSNKAYLLDLINRSFTRSSEILDISGLTTYVETAAHLIDIRYTQNSTDNDKVDDVTFLFMIKVINKVKDHEKPIPLLIHVTLDFVNKEILSRVSTKRNIYYSSGEFVKDIDLAKLYMRKVLRGLNMSKDIDVQEKEIIEKTVYQVHQEITELPEEIINKIATIEDETNQFINKSCEQLEINVGSDIHEDINNSIQNIFIKHIIASYPEKEKEIFKEGKYAYSIGISASGKSQSKVKHFAPADEAIHAVPEYQNVRSVLDETKKIDKNTLFWYSVLFKDTIRTKLYIDNEGYGIISLEEYVFEEDIDNVFSKIRSAKPATTIL